MERVTNKQILDAVKSIKTDTTKEVRKEVTKEIKNINNNHKEVLKRLGNIENRVYGMNDKITSNGKDIYWIKRIGIFVATILGGLWTSLFIDKGG